MKENPAARVIVRPVDGGGWLVFSKPRRLVSARRVAEVRPALAEVEAAVNREGLYAAGWLAYEAAPAFDPALRVRPARGFPLLWFGLFDRPARIKNLPPPAAPHWPEADWQPTVTTADYNHALGRVKDWIRNGDTYQVNYSYRLRKPWDGDPYAMFLRLAAGYRPRFGAFVEAGPWSICSASPELFFQLQNERIVSRPMKGTAARGRWHEEDMRRAAGLRQSGKECAENLMIVDMVRNDLGRIARPGSVAVPSLFTVERHPTVWQMTSTVTARTDASVSDILRALFPPASITGAPKARTMEIIAELETGPRRIYTGCIGCLAPGRQALFNVAIRSLLIHKPSRRAEYGVGGGIVWDSRTEGERFECRAKTAVLRPPPPSFDLLETMRWTPGRGYGLLRLHLRRLARSAAYFGFECDPRAIREALTRAAANFTSQSRRVRLTLSRRGHLSVHAAPWSPPTPLFTTLAPAREPVDAGNPFLYHKTTQREVYRRALAGRPGCRDVLLYNGQGEITESTIGNILLRTGKNWWTPPLSCGLLPGVRRAALLERGTIRERPFTLEQALAADEIHLVNALRGAGPVTIRRDE